VKDLTGMAAEPVLKVEGLSVSFAQEGTEVRAVRGVSFTVRKGETVALVGESGSGKSVTSLAAMQLIPERQGRVSKGDILFQGQSLLARSDDDMSDIRGRDMAMIFQEPMASFAPAITIGKQMVEQLQLHGDYTWKTARNWSIEMLDRVGISDASRRFDQYAFELSGGMRQRAMIAMALSTKPKLLIADEPTTALDVTIQAQVIDLMKDLVAEFHMGILFITHDLGVIAQTADRVDVMYLGRMIEEGPVREVIRNPKHPYTQGLLAALPQLDDLEKPLKPVPGDIPSPLERPSGCVFHTRCSKIVGDQCKARLPHLTSVNEDHTVSCHIYEEVTA